MKFNWKIGALVVVLAADFTLAAVQFSGNGGNQDNIAREKQIELLANQKPADTNSNGTLPGTQKNAIADLPEPNGNIDQTADALLAISRQEDDSIVSEAGDMEMIASEDQALNELQQNYEEF